MCAIAPVAYEHVTHSTADRRWDPLEAEEVEAVVVEAVEEDVGVAVGATTRDHLIAL